jgi:hypothetical protein
MKIKRFESKEEKVKDQEVLFTAKSLEKDKEEKPSFKTEVEDNEKVQKEFKKSMDKIEKFENFTIEVEVEVKPEGHEEAEEEESEESTGCCDDCTGEEGCGCCDDCNCGSEEVEQTNPENDVKVMNISDFIGSLNK